MSSPTRFWFFGFLLSLASACNVGANDPDLAGLKGAEGVEIPIAEVLSAVEGAYDQVLSAYRKPNDNSTRVRYVWYKLDKHLPSDALRRSGERRPSEFLDEESAFLHILSTLQLSTHALIGRYLEGKPLREGANDLPTSKGCVSEPSIVEGELLYDQIEGKVLDRIFEEHAVEDTPLPEYDLAMRLRLKPVHLQTGESVPTYQLLITASMKKVVGHSFAEQGPEAESSVPATFVRVVVGVRRINASDEKAFVTAYPKPHFPRLASSDDVEEN